MMLNPDPRRVLEVAQEWDPSPLLKAANASAGIGTNFTTMPTPQGVSPAPGPGQVDFGFSQMVNGQNAPQAPQAGAAPGAAPLNPAAIQSLMGMMAPPQAHVAPAAAAAPHVPQLAVSHPQVPQLRPAPTLAQILRGG